MQQYIFRQESCGSVLTIDIVSSQDPALAVQECFSLTQKFEQRYSRFIEGNRLDQVNASGEKSIELDDESYALIKFLLGIAEKTGWIFDPTIISTLESYGYDKEYSFHRKEWWPLGYKHVELKDHSLILHHGVQIEFGAIGKGYLLDVLSKSLLKAGFDHFLIDFGGDIIGYGGYEVWLENPFDLWQIIGKITVDGFAVASSNGTKRKVGDFHHLLNAHTGTPVHDIAGVYIAAPTGLQADTYSTAVFVSGAEQGKKLLENTDGITGLIVFSDGSYRKKEQYPGELFV